MKMSAIKETLPTMLALARERSEISRIQLAGHVGGYFPAQRYRFVAA